MLYPDTQDKTLRIVDNGEDLLLDHSGARVFHDGDSWWGLAVGFRVMQLAGEVLSEKQCWDRKNLNIVSGHPGPGVRDAIEYVTNCVSRNQFHLFDECRQQKNCGREMKFEWQISDGQKTVEIKLRDDFIPIDFDELLDRLGTENEKANDLDVFKQYKTELSDTLWNEPLATAFYIRLVDCS